MKKPDWPYIIILSSGIALAVAFLMALFSSQAKADSYLKLSAGPTKYAMSGVWADTANGYQAITDSGPMLSVGFGVSRSRYNIEYGILYLGKHELDALFGNPDDFSNSTSYKTIIGVQSGDVTGLYVNYSPKVSFSFGDAHFNLGAIYYRATWRGDFFQSSNAYNQQYDIGPRMASNRITWFAGIGATWGNAKSIRYGLDLNYYPVSVDGSKYRVPWNGGGGYKAITAVEFSVRVPI